MSLTDLPGCTFVGPALDDKHALSGLPQALRVLLDEANGLIAFDGGLHVRGVCDEPRWHSLEDAWRGEQAFHRHYRSVLDTDVPFGEDSVGDQYLLRDGQVVVLRAESDELEPLGWTLAEFLAAAKADPVEVLGLHPLLQLEQEGGRLQPGQLINVYPPFCAVEAGQEVSLRAISATDRQSFLMHLAEQIRSLPDGQKIRFVVKRSSDPAQE